MAFLYFRRINARKFKTIKETMFKYGEETKAKKANKQNKVLKQLDKLIKNNNENPFQLQQIEAFVENHKEDPELTSLIKEKLSNTIKK